MQDVKNVSVNFFIPKCVFLLQSINDFVNFLHGLRPFTLLEIFGDCHVNIYVYFSATKGVATSIWSTSTWFSPAVANIIHTEKNVTIGPMVSAKLTLPVDDIEVCRLEHWAFMILVSRCTLMEVCLSLPIVPREVQCCLTTVSRPLGEWLAQKRPQTMVKLLVCTIAVSRPFGRVRCLIGDRQCDWSSPCF